MADEVLAVQRDVLQQFRIIYGSMRQYFRLLEARCGLPGAQTWVLQEVERLPEIGVTELAKKIGVHQSTCSGLIDKLVGGGYLLKQKKSFDHRRIGLSLTDQGRAVLERLPGPAEGVLPKALGDIPPVCLRTLHTNLDELIRHLPGMNEAFANVPLAEMVNE